MPPVPPERTLLVAAETLAAMYRGVVMFETKRRGFTEEELATLQAIDGFGRTMRVEPPPTVVLVAECDEAA